MLLFEVCPQCPARELFDQIWREGEEREREREKEREKPEPQLYSFTRKPGKLLFSLNKWKSQLKALTQVAITPCVTLQVIHKRLTPQAFVNVVKPH
jgi:hypothetical protein